MRYAVALAAVVLVAAAGPVVAEDNLPVVKSAYLSTDNPRHDPQALFSVENQGSTTISYAVISCAALDGDTVLDVKPVYINNILPHSMAFGDVYFTNAIPGGSHVNCRVDRTS